MYTCIYYVVCVCINACVCIICKRYPEYPDTIMQIELATRKLCYS